MSQKTISEKIFEDLCASRSVPWQRIPAGPDRAPDYEIKLGSIALLVEVKQLDPNHDDSAALQRLLNHQTTSTVAPTKRVRDMIGKAYRQLKSSASAGKPCAVCLYDNTGISFGIDAFTVTTAMFGRFGVGLDLHADGIWRVGAQEFHGHRKLTQNTCRGISTILVMDQRLRDRITVAAYHNVFARTRIGPLLLSLIADQQFIHENPHERGFVDLLPKQIAT